MVKLQGKQGALWYNYIITLRDLDKPVFKSSQLLQTNIDVES